METLEMVQASLCFPPCLPSCLAGLHGRLQLAQCDGGVMGSPDTVPCWCPKPTTKLSENARSMVKVTGDLWLAHGSPAGPQAGVTITPDVLGNTMGV